MSGTASDVGGIVSATSCRKTVNDSRIVTPATNHARTEINWLHDFLIHRASLQLLQQPLLIGREVTLAMHHRLCGQLAAQWPTELRGASRPYYSPVYMKHFFTYTGRLIS